MKARMARIKELEEILARKKAATARYRLIWVNPQTGERTDAATGMRC